MILLDLIHNILMGILIILFILIICGFWTMRPNNLRACHIWKTTHVNRYQIPTGQVCEKCGLSRKANAKKGAALEYVWEYGNGAESEPFSFGEGF